MNQGRRKLLGVNFWSIGRLALWSLWAPILWVVVIASGDGSDVFDSRHWYFRGRLQYTVWSLLSLFAAAAFLNLSLWLVRRRFPKLAVVLWVPSVGIPGLLLYVGGLFALTCESDDVFSCVGARGVFQFTLFMSSVMALFTSPGWVILGLRQLHTKVIKRPTSGAPLPERQEQSRD